jgi:hypothetical protein
VFTTGNRLTDICEVIACGLIFITSAASALAQNHPTMLEHQLLQNRVVRTSNPEKLILGISEAFFDLNLSSVGVSTTLYPAYLESFKKGEEEIDYTGSTARCSSSNSGDDCGEGIKLELSHMKDDKYLIKLTVSGGTGTGGNENFDKEVYRRYFEAISKSLFLEKADLELAAPTQE